VINPSWQSSAGGVFQDSSIAGPIMPRTTAGGGFVATTWKPTDAIKVTADYVHTDVHGLPDFGVPYYRPGSTGVSGQMLRAPLAVRFGLSAANQRFLWLRKSPTSIRPIRISRPSTPR